MAHLRLRTLEKLISKAVGWAPIVGVTGARQSGKTTLLKRVSGAQLSFDDPSLQDRFASSGLLALDGLKRPVLLDEVQKYPPIFDLLKLAVEESRRPGQFLITGSVRFSSKAAIRESLTGRGQFWEILPLTIQECQERPLDDFLALLMTQGKSLDSKLKALERRVWCKDSAALDYLHRGGLPGICFLRDAAQRVQAMDSYLETSLTRDLQMLYQPKFKYTQTLDLYREVVKEPGLPINHSALARRFASSVPTVKAALRAMEGIYLIRGHGKGYYAEDPAFSRGLSRLPNEVRSFVFNAARSWVTYLKEHQPTFGEFNTRGGSHVPFVIRTRGGETLGITADEGDTPSEKNLKSLYSLARQDRHALLVCVHRGDRAFVHKDKVLVLPWTWVV